MTTKALIHLVDDDAGIRDSLRCLLTSIDLDVACYATAAEFLAVSDTAQPGCVLLDLRIPDMSGLEVQRICRERGFPKPIIFLTGHADVEVSVRAMRHGAAEFLTKPINEEVLLEKIRSAIEQCRHQQAERQRRASIQARVDLLTPRETEVLEGVVDGLSNKEIARLMTISPKTVELHRHNVMAKMHATSLAQLVRLYLQVEPEAEGEDTNSGRLA